MTETSDRNDEQPGFILDGARLYHGPGARPDIPDDARDAEAAAYVGPGGRLVLNVHPGAFLHLGYGGYIRALEGGGFVIVSPKRED